MTSVQQKATDSSTDRLMKRSLKLTDVLIPKKTICDTLPKTNMTLEKTPLLIGCFSIVMLVSVVYVYFCLTPSLITGIPT